MTTVKKINAINWALAGLVIVLIMGLFGYIIQDSRVQAEQIFTNTNRLTAIESKPLISNKVDIEKVEQDIIAIKIKQASMDSKLDMLIAITADINRKIDRHMSDSIPKPTMMDESKTK